MTPEEGLKHAWILEALTQPGTTSGTITPNGIGSSSIYGSTPRSAQPTTQAQAPVTARVVPKGYVNIPFFSLFFIFDFFIVCYYYCFFLFFL